MSALRQVLSEIDTLSSDELEQVYRHIVQRRQPTYWLVPGDQLKAIREIMSPVHEQTANMTDDEINAAIDEALDEVRRERPANRSD